MQYQPTWIKLYFTHHTRKVSEIICKPLELTELETWDISQFNLWQPAKELLSCWAEIRADTTTRSFTWNKSPGVLKASLHITLQARALTWLWHSEHPQPLHAETSQEASSPWPTGYPPQNLSKAVLGSQPNTDSYTPFPSVLALTGLWCFE